MDFFGFINPVPSRQPYIYSILFLAFFAASMVMRLLNWLWELKSKAQRLVLTGNHSIMCTDSSARIFIDGHEVGETVFLTQGEHGLSVLGDPQGDLEVLFDPKGFRPRYLIKNDKDSFLCVE